MFGIFKKKKRRIKRSKYRISATDYEITILNNFIANAIYLTKKSIELTSNRVELEKLINERNSLYHLSNELGFSIYNNEYLNRKDVHEEVDSIIRSRSILEEKEEIENKGDKNIGIVSTARSTIAEI